MILVADSGSTKTDWRLINGQEIKQFECKGLNPDFNTTEDVREAVATTFDMLNKSEVSALYFYGSGCSSPSRNAIVEKGLTEVFPSAEIHVWHDLLGAARASCGKDKGLAGILGTGSNCCLFDGEEIIEEYRTGGYIMGDEGGGVYLGKKLLKAFIEERLPNELRERFIKRYDLNVDGILHNLYKEAYPNRFMASFSNFIFHHKQDPFIAQLISDSFEDYFDIQVCRFEEYKEIPLNLVGSIAFYYHDFIREVAAAKGVRVGTILEKPISGLSLYHSQSGGE